MKNKKKHKDKKEKKAQGPGARHDLPRSARRAVHYHSYSPRVRSRRRRASSSRKTTTFSATPSSSTGSATPSSSTGSTVPTNRGAVATRSSRCCPVLG